MEIYTSLEKDIKYFHKSMKKECEESLECYMFHGNILKKSINFEVLLLFIC